MQVAQFIRQQLWVSGTQNEHRFKSYNHTIISVIIINNITNTDSKVTTTLSFIN